MVCGMRDYFSKAPVFGADTITALHVDGDWFFFVASTRRWSHFGEMTYGPIIEDFIKALELAGIEPDEGYYSLQDAVDGPVLAYHMDPEQTARSWVTLGPSS